MRTESCPLLQDAKHLAVDKGLPVDRVRCCFLETGVCPGSTNEDDCLIIGNGNFRKFTNPDKAHFLIESAEAAPINQTQKFTEGLKKTAAINGISAEV